MLEAYLVAGGIAVVLVVAVLWFALRRRRPTAAPPAADDSPESPQAQLQRLKQSPRFSGIAVEPHCRASSGLAGKKYPLERAPELPVPGCDAPACACRYIGLPDRRRVPERRLQPDRRLALRMESNRRSGRPRRESDRVTWTEQYNL